MPDGFATSEEHIRRKWPKCGGTTTRCLTMTMRRGTTCLKWSILGLWKCSSTSSPHWIALFVLVWYASENEIWYTMASLLECFYEAFETVHHNTRLDKIWHYSTSQQVTQNSARRNWTFITAEIQFRQWIGSCTTCNKQVHSLFLFSGPSLEIVVHIEILCKFLT
jgi:hypothetical protein